MKDFKAVRLFPHITSYIKHAHFHIQHRGMLLAHGILENSQYPKDRIKTSYNKNLGNISGMQMDSINNEMRGGISVSIQSNDF